MSERSKSVHCFAAKVDGQDSSAFVKLLLALIATTENSREDRGHGRRRDDGYDQRCRWTHPGSLEAVESSKWSRSEELPVIEHLCELLAVDPCLRLLGEKGSTLLGRAPGPAEDRLGVYLLVERAVAPAGLLVAPAGALIVEQAAEQIELRLGLGAVGQHDRLEA